MQRFTVIFPKVFKVLNEAETNEDTIIGFKKIPVTSYLENGETEVIQHYYKLYVDLWFVKFKIGMVRF